MPEDSNDQQPDLMPEEAKDDAPTGQETSWSDEPTPDIETEPSTLGLESPNASDDNSIPVRNNNAVVASEPWKSTDDEPTSPPVFNSSPIDTTPEPASPLPLQNFDNQPTVPTPASKPPKKSKKKLLIALIVAAVIVVLVGGSALAYFVWYQNPQKVLTDAFANALHSSSSTFDGTISNVPKSTGTDVTTPNDGRVGVQFDGKSTKGSALLNMTLKVNSDGKDATFKGGGVYDSNGDLYLKVGGLNDFLTAYLGTSGMTLPSTYTDFVKKVDDKWIKISADKLKDVSPEASKTQTCVTNVLDKLQHDNSYAKEIGDAYRNNQFIVVDEKLSSKDGSLGYVISSDHTKAKSFAKSLENTKLYKELKACGDETVPSSDDLVPKVDSTTDKGTTRLEVWVDKWSHQLTGLSFTGDDETSKTSITLNTKFNQQVTVTAPSDSMSVDELKTEIDKLTESFASDFTGGGSSLSSSNELNASSVNKYAEMYFAYNGKYPTFKQLVGTSSADLKAVLSTSAPSATYPTRIQYVPCKSNPASGGQITYFDSATRKNVQIAVGSCGGNQT